MLRDRGQFETTENVLWNIWQKTYSVRQLKKEGLTGKEAEGAVKEKPANLEQICF